MLEKLLTVTMTPGVRALGCGLTQTSAPESADTGRTSGEVNIWILWRMSRGIRIFIFRNDNEQTQWLPTNIKHVSEVSRYDDQVNRYIGMILSRDISHNSNLIRILEYKYFDEAHKHSCNGHRFRCIGALGFCACWRNNHTFPAPVCNIWLQRTRYLFIYHLIRIFKLKSDNC